MSGRTFSRFAELPMSIRNAYVGATTSYSLSSVVTASREVCFLFVHLPLLPFLLPDLSFSSWISLCGRVIMLQLSSVGRGWYSGRIPFLIHVGICQSCTFSFFRVGFRCVVEQSCFNWVPSDAEDIAVVFRFLYMSVSVNLCVRRLTAPPFIFVLFEFSGWFSIFRGV